MRRIQPGDRICLETQRGQILSTQELSVKRLAQRTAKYKAPIHVTLALRE